MKERVITAVIFVLIILAIGFLDNPLIDTIIITMLSLAGIYEYNKAFKNVGYKPISWLGYVSCLAMFLMGGIVSEEDKITILKVVVPITLIVIFSHIVFTRFKRTIIDVAITVFSLLYIPFMFSFLKLILTMQIGRFFTLFVFSAAFVSDTFAYIIGSKLGKHKLCEISPNKTIEGSIGGIIGVIVAFVILTIFGNVYYNLDLSMIIMIMAGIVAGIAGQMGDLSSSAIKRFCKIKDFGNILPGHGGILDRFDSILFVAPIMYIFLKLYIL